MKISGRRSLVLMSALVVLVLSVGIAFGYGPSTAKADRGVIVPPVLSTFEQIPDRDLNVVHPSSPSVRIGNFIYVITGESESLGVLTSEIERAEILGNGEISPWVVAGHLPSSRSQAVAAATESNIYVLGDHPGVTSVDRVPVLPDGSLGAPVPGRPMSTARMNGGAFVHNGFLHVIGGSDNAASPTILSVGERARIKRNGTLGPWEFGPSLNTPRSGFGIVTTDTYVWVIGGGTPDGSSETIERAELLPRGRLGPWELVPTTILGRSDVTALLVGGCILLVGGSEVGSAGATDQVDCIEIDDNEDIVEVYPQPELTLRRSVPVVFRDHQFVFVTGGALFEPGPGLTGWTTTERAEIVGPPLCMLDMNVTHQSNHLEFEFSLGTVAPATWNLWASIQNDNLQILSTELPATDPPVNPSFSIPASNLGTIGLMTTLTTPTAGIICWDFEIVDTGPITEQISATDLQRTFASVE